MVLNLLCCQRDSQQGDFRRKLKECERVQAAVVLDAQLSEWFTIGKVQVQWY